ncbi:MAG: sel1 repeat family protein [Muribaculaceae bacterium]|nr:sel1 repeat family protein [Muribaculaceae bacterium]
MMKLFLKTIIAVTLFFSIGIFSTKAAVPDPDLESWEECARRAQTGDAEAQYRMGCMYKDGKNVEKDYKEAIYWFRKSASNGNGDAMLEVGHCFEDGLGVLADNRIAAENYWRAAEKGNMEGAYRYAEMLRDGIGVAQDKRKAYYWFRKAASANFSDSAEQAAKLKGVGSVKSEGYEKKQSKSANTGRHTKIKKRNQKRR